MKQKHAFSIMLFLLPILGLAQNSIEEILRSSQDFSTIVDRANAFFSEKYPQLTPGQLTSGEFRDSDYVKFRRWQAFWSQRLDERGYLADITAHFRNSRDTDINRNNPYQNVAWTNISYDGYITGQIGLGRTTAIGFHPTDPDTWYVGAAIGGIWRTTDNGQTYTPLGDDLPFLAISSIVVDADDPNTIYIAVSDHVWYGPPGIGIYKSTNGGTTWQSTDLSLEFSWNERIYWMEVDPSDSNTLLVATQGGLYRTTDGFDNATLVTGTNCYNVRFHPGNSNIVYLGDNSGRFYRSINNGASFTQITDFGNGSVYLEISQQNTDHVYARVGTALHKSTDSGQTFNQVGTFLENNEVFRLALSDDNIILSGNFEINRSTNGGSSFTAITQWLGNGGLPLIHVDQRNAFTNPLQSDFVYFCNDGGVYRYQVSTQTFENLCDGLEITQFYDIAVSQTDANIVGGGSQDNGNVYRTSGGSWQQYASTGDGMNQDIDPTDANVRFWSYQLGGIRRWSNGTNSNIKPNNSGDGAWETPFKLDPSNADRLIVAYDVVYESLNQGNSWTTISGSLAGGNDMQELAIAPSNGERIYAVRGSTIYVKATNSDTWTSKALPSGSISDIEVDFDDMNIVYVSATGYSDGNKVWKSTDAGDSWTNISGTLPNVSTGAIELVEGTDGGIFVGNDEGVYYRDNQSGQWQTYGNLPNTRVEDIEIQNSSMIVRVGTHGRGVLEAPLVVSMILPVEWSKFTVTSEKNHVADLEWVLESADNVSQFVIERAEDRVTFQPIGQVAFANSTHHVYQYRDDKISGDQAYYRIKAVDYDGSYSYSAIRVITWEEQIEIPLTAYPNPTAGLLSVDIPRGEARVVNWEVINLQGQLILKGIYSIDEQEENCHLNLNRLSSGAYILTVQDGNSIRSLQFVKQ